jgi:hypothetical protein
VGRFAASVLEFPNTFDWAVRFFFRRLYLGPRGAEGALEVFCKIVLRDLPNGCTGSTGYDILTRAVLIAVRLVCGPSVAVDHDCMGILWVARGDVADRDFVTGLRSPRHGRIHRERGSENR